MGLVITFSRRQWYRQKRFIIPICFLITLLIVGTIIGTVLGTRSKTNPTGMIVDVLFS
jgi:F0F1-type ATP synthase assembly protein I